MLLQPHGRHAQKARAVNSATPLLIQWLCSLCVLSSIIMMKLVLCPVVDRVPARVNVLYLQQEQTIARLAPCMAIRGLHGAHAALPEPLVETSKLSRVPTQHLLLGAALTQDTRKCPSLVWSYAAVA